MDCRDIYSLIPAGFRKRGILVAVSLFARAILDFAGVVVFIPVLAGVLEKEGDVHAVLPVAAAALAFILIKNVAVFFLSRFRSRYVFSLYTVLAERVLGVFIGKGLLFIRRSDSVDLANKVNAVTMTFTSGVIMSMLNIFSSVLLLLIIMTALFIYEPWPTLALLLVIGPFMFLYSFYLRKRMRSLGITENNARRSQSRSVFELFRGYSDYYINGAVDRQLKKFHYCISKVSDVRMKTESYSSVSSGFMEMTMMLSIIILVLLSVSAAWGMSMTFGIFALSAMKILPSVRAVVAGWQSVQSAGYSVSVLKGILEEVPAKEVAGRPLSFSTSIDLRSVSFRYPDSARYIFRNLDLRIRKGEYVGIKGHSGAGKTTLFNLLMGFYQPESGGLYVDDEKISSDNVSSWQALLGYVPQDVFLVNGTFVENVAFGEDPETADRERIRQMFIKTGLWDWISGLPDGMDTTLAEAGNSISGGQKQRIGIARALYKGASVLFFDEATSSVDMEAETEIIRSISGLSEGDTSLTIIVIAHRRETLSACRRIIDLDALE